MAGHPEGLALTGELLSLAGLRPPGRVADFGAGEGETLAYLRKVGYAAIGVDSRMENAKDVLRADMRATPFADGSFDAVIAECSLSVCGDADAALREARRVLVENGLLLLSDFYFRDKEEALWRRRAVRGGFAVAAFRDRSELWLPYYLESLWRTGEALLSPHSGAARNGKPGYFLMVCRREGS